jgi:SAM-dependent methyltransferase
MLRRLRSLIAGPAAGPRPAVVPVAADPFAAGTFPLCPATHDVGLGRLFDVATVLLLLDCRPGDRVLDLGAGAGFSSELLARLGYHVVAADPDLRALGQNRRRPACDAGRIAGTVRVASALAERLPFSEAAFDGVVGLNVMHHVDDLSLALRELARVLRPGARAVFCEPGLDHLHAAETQRALREHGEDDKAFDVLAFLREARTLGFKEAMLSATLQSPLALVPIEEVELYRSGQHPRPHLRPDGVLDELHRRHAYAMLVREGARPRTSRHPGRLARRLQVLGLGTAASPGQRLQLAVEAENTGDTTWIAEPSALGGFVTVGLKLLEADGYVIDSALGRTLLPHDVRPGERVVVPVTCALPSRSGDFRLEVDLVDELICWFADLDRASAVEHRLRVG